MSNSHHEKYVTQLVLGLFLLTLGVFLILYAAIENKIQLEWYVWALISTITVCTGIIFLGKAFVHKVKSDLIRRQRHREGPPELKVMEKI